VQNYLEFNELVARFGQQLVVLGFPCAQFFNQEPGRNDEILNCLKYVRPGNGYVPHFIQFQKVNVNGDTTQIHPVYNYLKASCGQPSLLVAQAPFILWSPVTVTDITWNFEKFLIDKRGKPFKRYSPTTNPQLLVPDIVHLLSG